MKYLVYLVLTILIYEIYFLIQIYLLNKKEKELIGELLRLKKRKEELDKEKE